MFALDSQSDLALVKPQMSEESEFEEDKFISADIGDSFKLEFGDDVYAFGK